MPIRRNRQRSRVTRKQVAAHLVLALAAAALTYAFAYLSGLSPTSLEVAALVIAVLIPSEFLVIELQIRSRRTR